MVSTVTFEGHTDLKFARGAEGGGEIFIAGVHSTFYGLLYYYVGRRGLPEGTPLELF